MLSKVENRRKRLTILLIPDDDTEPFSLNLTTRFIKFLLVIGVFLLIHIILGGIFYWRYAVLNRENSKLRHQNAELSETREKIYEILPVVDDLVKEQEKVLNAMGVKEQGFTNFSHSNPLQATPKIDNYAGIARQSESNKPILKGTQTENLDFLKEKKSQFHDFVRNLPTWLPVAGYMSQEFTPLNWLSVLKREGHLGIDIVADVGTPIHAAGDGFVVFSEWTFDLGYLIIIYHGSGFFTYYGHNDRNVVTNRTYVRKGEVIGFVGSSGQSSGPHLHFEVWRNGSAIDPKDVLIAFQ
ncbi:M23 family metallopeptidase [candidate division KSB1 bacterium]|nr:M23 family metallopeptidase [candidate division KSB1 bacterium]